MTPRHELFVPRTLRTRRLTAALAVVMSIVITSCGSLGNNDETEGLWSPFTSQTVWDIGDGRMLVELNGHERGHEPGRTAEFTVNIENRRQEPVEVDVCTKLIDQSQIVQRFEQFPMVIEYDERASETFEVTIDEEIEPGAYGFAVVVEEIGAIIHTIRVGIPDDEPAPWLDVDGLVCD